MCIFVALGVVYGAVLGACLASFGCVVSERVPAGRGINGRSQCACGRQLRASENIPVIGWLRARGGTACCGATLPARYVQWELAYAGWGALVLGGAGAGWASGELGLGEAAGAGALLLAFFPVLLVATWQRER